MINTDEFIRWAQGHDGAAIQIEVERDAETIARDRPGATFSVEAVDNVFDALKAWIGTRLMRPFQHGMPGATKMRVTLKVELDGQSAALEVPVKLTIVDGTIRAQAARNNQV